MKCCQVCKQEYVADRKTCRCVEAPVIEARAEEDRYTGRMIDGRFEVLRKLGGGAMGSVYLAEQVDAQKRVALKILYPQFATDAAYVKQFCAAARLAMGLRHPNIATVIDFDQTTDGCLFIAMDYVDGEALDRVIERAGRLPVDQALDFGAQIAEGLAAAHRRGVLHRAIRPQNILVIGDGETVKITDFGVPRIQHGNSSSRLGQSEVALGTPEYTAPEQVRGAEPTEQTDVYILGIVLYQMLTGQVPFRASTHLGTLFCQINEAPAAVRQLRPEVPAAVEALVMRALEKKPEKRHSTMARMAKELRQFAKVLGPQSSARSPALLRRSDVAIARRALRWKAASAVTLGVLAFAGYFGFIWESTPVASAPVSSMRQSQALWPESGETTSTAVPISTGSETGLGMLNEPPDTLAKIEERGTKSAAPAGAVKQPEPKPLLTEVKARQPAFAPVLAGEKIITGEPNLPDLQPVARALPAPLPLPQPQQQLPPPMVKIDERELARIHNLIEQTLRNQGLLKVSESDRWGVTVDASAAGVVTLKGFLLDQTLREEAVRLVRDVPGVSDVRTNIGLQNPPDGG